MGDLKIKRVVMEYEERVVVWEGEAAKKMEGLIESYAGLLDLYKAEYGGPTTVPLPTYIYDARKPEDFPK